MKDASGDPICLSTDAALSFARGDLSPEALQALDAHIDGCPDCQRLVVEAVRGMNSQRLDISEPSYQTVFQTNALVGGRYRIRRFLARGGMGEVYYAWDLELDVPVALKTVAMSVSDSSRAARYLKAEVLLARRIAHPNVCRIYDWGSHPIEGSAATIYFLTMEYIEGRSLAKHLRANGPLPIDQVQEIAKQLLVGLDAAHTAGILHRDFKSDNVMLRVTAGRLSAVILDFGLAHPLDRDPESSSRGPAGTMAYMAPEQLEGKKLAPTTDLYAFGVVCFEMLTGKRPFEDEHGVEVPFERLRTAAQPPSRRNPAIPIALDQIVLTCLERDPQERFQSAKEVLAAFERLQRPPPQSVSPSVPFPVPLKVDVRRVALRVAALLPLAAMGTYLWLSVSDARVQESSLPKVNAPNGNVQSARDPRVQHAPAEASEPEGVADAPSVAGSNGASEPSRAPSDAKMRGGSAIAAPGLPEKRRSSASRAAGRKPESSGPARPAVPATPSTKPPSGATTMPGWERIEKPAPARG